MPAYQIEGWHPSSGERSHPAAQQVFRCALSPVRVVLDTNVLLSRFVFADSRYAAQRAALERGRWQALTDARYRGKFRRVLVYETFGLDAAALVAAAPLPQCRDPDDQRFLELARDGGASLAGHLRQGLAPARPPPAPLPPHPHPHPRAGDGSTGLVRTFILSDQLPVQLDDGDILYIHAGAADPPA